MALDVNWLIADLKNKEQSFQERDYLESSDEYYLIKYLVEQHINNDDICLYTDDVQYGPWVYVVPKEWQEKSLSEMGSKKYALDRYIIAMNHMQELYHHLDYFIEDISRSFPESRIIIRTPIIYNKQYFITMNLLIGQGSDFTMSVYEPKLDEYKDILSSPIIDWADLVSVAKMSKDKQIEWYIDNCLFTIARTKDNSFTRVSRVTPENRDIVLSIIKIELGKETSLYKILNNENFDRKIGNFTL